MRPIRMIGKGIGIIAVVALAAMLFGYFVMSLWNWLIPAIFHGVGMINFWQAVGLLVLTRILFHGFGSHRGHHHGRWNKWNHKGHWSYWAEKWESMTPEEREKMKADWKGGWYSWKQKWEQMTPDQKAEMKARWKERCSRWDRGRYGHPMNAFMNEDEAAENKTDNPETPKP